MMDSLMFSGQYYREKDLGSIPIRSKYVILVCHNIPGQLFQCFNFLFQCLTGSKKALFITTLPAEFEFIPTRSCLSAAQSALVSVQFLVIQFLISMPIGQIDHEVVSKRGSQYSYPSYIVTLANLDTIILTCYNNPSQVFERFNALCLLLHVSHHTAFGTFTYLPLNPVYQYPSLRLINLWQLSYSR